MGVLGMTRYGTHRTQQEQLWHLIYGMGVDHLTGIAIARVT